MVVAQGVHLGHVQIHLGGLLRQELLHPLVDLDALGLVEGAAAFRDHLIELGVLVPDAVDAADAVLAEAPRQEHVRIPVAAPAGHEHGGLVAGDVGREDRVLDAHDLDLDVDLGQVGLDRGGDALGLVAEDHELGGEARAVGLLHQGLGLFQVVGVLVERVLDGPEHGGGVGEGGAVVQDHSPAVVADLHAAVVVHGEGHGLAHQLVLEPAQGVVHAQVPDQRRGLIPQLELGVLHHAFVVGGHEFGVQVGGPGLDGDGPVGAFGDDLDGQGLVLGHLVLVEVAVEALELHGVADHAADELVAAAADGLGPVLGLLGLLGVALGHDAGGHVGQGGGHGRVGAVGDDGEGLVVDLLDLLHRLEQGAEGRAGLGPVQGVHHVVHGQGGAVMVLDVVPDGEVPLRVAHPLEVLAQLLDVAGEPVRWGR